MGTHSFYAQPIPNGTYGFEEICKQAHKNTSIETHTIRAAVEEYMKVAMEKLCDGFRVEIGTQFLTCSPSIDAKVKDELKHDAPEDKVKLVSYVVSTAYGLKPGANVKVEINGQQYEAGATGDGQYDAFVKALRFIYRKYLDRTFPLLANYQVSIPPGGRTDALVQTVITWNDNGRLLRTRGLDADQTEAAIKATFKMLNIVESSNSL